MKQNHTSMTALRPLVRALRTLAFAAFAAMPVHAAFAQDDTTDAPPAGDDDDLGSIIGTDPTTSGSGSTVADERAGLQSETEAVALPPAKRKVIKTLQPKFFLKLHRFEFTPFVGMVTNDPFIRRIMFGGDVAYHFTELFAFELQGSFDPNFGQGDWKPITHQITGANQVSPEISRMMWHLTGNFNFSPFYGKLATVGRNTIMFDIYGTFGAGVVGTADDLELIGNAGDPRAEATRTQVHPTLTFGGGLRVAFNKTFALRFEARSLSYIGVLESTKLELKNNLALMLGGSVFFGRRVE